MQPKNDKITNYEEQFTMIETQYEGQDSKAPPLYTLLVKLLELFF